MPQQQDDEEWRNISNNAIYKSWGGAINFMHSYGLKEYNSEDWDTARDIRDTMKQNDWEMMSERERDEVRAHYDKYNGGSGRK